MIFRRSNSCFFEEQQIVNEDENVTSRESVEVGITSQMLQASYIFDDCYSMSVILEGELSSTEIQTDVGNIYGKQQSAFAKFDVNNKKRLLDPTDKLL